MTAALLGDVATLTRRHLRLMARRPASVIGAVVLPLLFAVLFLTILSRPMARLGVDYAQHLVPAIVVQSIFFAAMSAAVWAAEDASGGMVDRLRSLPVARTAPLLGLLGGELTRCCLSLAVALGAGQVIGFGFQRGSWATLGFLVTALAAAAAVCLGYLVLGFALRSVEAVQSVGGVAYYPLLLVSTLFVPASAFPDWLRPAVEHQPFSRVVDALRALSTDGVDDPARAVLIAWVWILGAFAVFTVLAARVVGRRG
ncbi:MAG: ABC transporter permease [Aeromicrobium sp.]|uniref:ABC transporter permease n=1 Tax=Aeromicrobium sp. TaxID=1871063 RepID=UPI0039E5B324